MSERTRRSVLLGTATLTTAALAGCVSDGGDDDGADNDSDDGADNDSDDGADNGGTDNDQPDIVSSSIETLRTGSRTEEHSEAVELDVGEDAVTITGTILTSTPHFEAVLEETAIEDGSLQVTIDTESTLDEDEAGTQELGFLDYEATVEIENIDSLERAAVQHPETKHGFEWDENSASASASGSSETETSTAEGNTSESEAGQ